jgi:hypothetical protein
MSRIFALVDSPKRNRQTFRGTYGNGCGLVVGGAGVGGDWYGPTHWSESVMPPGAIGHPAGNPALAQFSDETVLGPEKAASQGDPSRVMAPVKVVSSTVPRILPE